MKQRINEWWPWLLAVTVAALVLGSATYLQLQRDMEQERHQMRADARIQQLLDDTQKLRDDAQLKDETLAALADNQRLMLQQDADGRAAVIKALKELPTGKTVIVQPQVTQRIQPQQRRAPRKADPIKRTPQTPSPFPVGVSETGR